MLKGETIVFTVETKAAGLERVKVMLSDDLSGYVGYASEYYVNDAGNYVWKIEAPAPDATAKYVFDWRSEPMGNYLKDYYFYLVEINDGVNIKSVDYSFFANELVFTVVTSAGDFGAVKVTTLDNLNGCIDFSDEYTVNEQEDYLFKITLPMPTETAEYAFDVRKTDESEYLNSYYFVTLAPLKYGDVNGDCLVTPQDRVILTRYLANWKGYEIDLAAADVNCDGKVNSLDRVILTRHLAKWTGYESLPYLK